MNVVATNVYGKVETLVDLGFADAFAMVTTDTKNNRESKHLALIYKKSDLVFNKDGTFKFRKYHKHLISEEKLPDVPWYMYMSDDFFELMKKTDKHFTEISVSEYDVTTLLVKGLIKAPKAENLIFRNYSEHLFKRYTDGVPLSPVVIFDYISVFNDLDMKLDAALKYLKKHKYVLSADKEEIPYYNKDNGREYGLRMKIKLPQDVWEKVWKKGDRWKDEIEARSWVENAIDPLGIRQFQRTKEEISKIEDEREEHSDDNY